MLSTLTYPQAIITGLFQGVTELFPISSLGHSVLLPGWLGWDNIVHEQSKHDSYYLVFLVVLHMATALALLIYYRKDWIKVIKGFFNTLKTRKIETVDERMAWLLIVGTIPVALIGLIFEGALKDLFAKPIAAAIFLTINGLILTGGEQLRRRSEVRRLAAAHPQHENPEAGRELDNLQLKEGFFIGCSQVLALFAGISRSGVTMVGGLLRGLNHEDAVRFSFMLATPIIFGAGLYKLPEFLGPYGDGIRAQALVGAAFAGVASYISIKFLVRFFKSNNLNPFAIYCLIFGIVSIIKFA